MVANTFGSGEFQDVRSGQEEPRPFEKWHPQRRCCGAALSDDLASCHASPSPILCRECLPLTESLAEGTEPSI